MRSLCIIFVSVGLLMFSAGCAVTQDQNTPVGEWSEVNPVSGTNYWIYVPSTYSHDVPMRVVVTCHGTPPFDVSNMHIRAWKMVGEDYNCIIVSPDLGATDGILGDGPLVGMLRNERIIMNIISELGYRYNIDLGNIMIWGFSGGGFPTYWVGLRHPEIFSVVVAQGCNFSEPNLDGWYPADATQTPVLIYYGSHDPGTIISQSQHGIRYLRNKGFNVEEDRLAGVGHERLPEVAMRFFAKHAKLTRPSLPTN